MAKSGHHFPASHGFKGSTGKIQNVRGYTRKVGKAAGGMTRKPIVTSAPKPMPSLNPRGPVKPPPTLFAPSVRIPRAPVAREPLYAGGGFVMKSETIGDQGNSAVKRGNPPTAEADKDYGGNSPLRTGYKKGGVTKSAARSIAKSEVAAHVAKPAPKGHRGFSKTPMFGKK